LSALLLTAASAAWAEDKEIQIEKFRENIYWYNCKTETKIEIAKPPPTPRFAKVLPNGFVEVMDETRHPSGICVKPFAFVTKQKIPVKDECGTVVAQRTGSTRGLGEKECKDQQGKK
jgi:hypothetical protein